MNMFNKSNGRRHIYFLEVKIFSDKRKMALPVKVWVA